MHEVRVNSEKPLKNVETWRGPPLVLYLGNTGPIHFMTQSLRTDHRALFSQSNRRMNIFNEAHSSMSPLIKLFRLLSENRNRMLPALFPTLSLPSLYASCIQRLNQSIEKHSEWDPMPKLTVTSPYIGSDTCNMGNPSQESTLTRCQSRLYPSVGE